MNKSALIALSALVVTGYSSLSLDRTSIAIANPTAPGNQANANSKAQTDRTAAVKDIKTTTDLSRWMNYYYLHPQPELTIKAIDYIQKNNLATPDARNSLIAFFSQVMAQNPQSLATWTEHFKTLNNGMKGILWTALWQANTPESKKQLKVFTNSLPADLQKATSKMPPPQPIEKMSINGPGVLDRLWSSFCVTGDERYVKRIIEALPPPNTHGAKQVSGNIANEMMLAGAAKWSLTSNAHQHKKVLAICMQVKQQTQNPALKKELTTVIEKAQK